MFFMWKFFPVHHNLSFIHSFRLASFLCLSVFCCLCWPSGSSRLREFLTAFKIARLSIFSRCLLVQSVTSILSYSIMYKTAYIVKYSITEIQSVRIEIRYGSVDIFLSLFSILFLFLSNKSINGCLVSLTVLTG